MTQLNSINNNNVNNNNFNTSQFTAVKTYGHNFKIYSDKNNLRHPILKTNLINSLIKQIISLTKLFQLNFSFETPTNQNQQMAIIEKFKPIYDSLNVSQNHSFLPTTMQKTENLTAQIVKSQPQDSRPLTPPRPTIPHSLDKTINNNNNNIDETSVPPPIYPPLPPPIPPRPSVLNNTKTTNSNNNSILIDETSIPPPIPPRPSVSNETILPENAEPLNTLNLTQEENELDLTQEEKPTNNNSSHNNLLNQIKNHKFEGSSKSRSPSPVSPDESSSDSLNIANIMLNKINQIAKNPNLSNEDESTADWELDTDDLLNDKLFNVLPKTQQTSVKNENPTDHDSAVKVFDNPAPTNDVNQLIAARLAALRARTGFDQDDE